MEGKDANTENGHFTKAIELECKVVFGRLEEPLIAAPFSEARRGNSQNGKTPCW